MRFKILAVGCFTLLFSPILLRSTVPQSHHIVDTSSAYPLVNPIRFSVPFAFYAGDAHMPAGEYTISRLDIHDGKVLHIASKDGKQSASFLTHPNDPGASSKRSEVTFNKYGTGHYFLSEIAVKDHHN